MDRLNKVIVIVVAVATALASAVALLAAAGVWSPPPALVGEPLAEWLTLLGEGGAHAGVIAASAVALALSVALLAAELRGDRRGPHLVAETERGRVTVTRATVRDFIAHVVSEVPDVRGVAVCVEDGDEGLEVTCHVDANTHAKLDELGERVREAVSQRVREQLCLPVHRVEVHARMSAHRQRRPVVK